MRGLAVQLLLSFGNSCLVIQSVTWRGDSGVTCPRAASVPSLPGSVGSDISASILQLLVPTFLPDPFLPPFYPSFSSFSSPLLLLLLLLLLLSRFSRVQLCATPWTAAHQAPLSMGFSRQEYWSGLPLPSLIFCPRVCYFFFLKLILLGYS